MKKDKITESIIATLDLSISLLQEKIADPEVNDKSKAEYFNALNNALKERELINRVGTSASKEILLEIILEKFKGG